MKYTAIFSGYFTIDDSNRSVGLIDKGWTRIDKSVADIKMYENFYYSEFVAFNFGKDVNSSLIRYSKSINKQVSIGRTTSNGVETFNFKVNDVTIYIAPHNMLMYSIYIEKECGNLNDCTALAFLIRNVCGYHNILADEFIKVAIQPIVDIYNIHVTLTGSKDNDQSSHFDCSRLIENGNKLKTFQVLQLTDDIWNKTDIDVLLFELGTLSPIGSYNPKSLQSSSEIYFKQLIKDNSLSIYNNWKALSLFDSFTILSNKCPDWLYQNWINDYFGMIYISQLYKRYYLFRTNLYFKFNKVNIEKLSEEFLRFERNHCFYKISYNFLPQLVNGSIEKGLEIIDEKKELYHMIDQENVEREKKDDGRMNKLLFFLTCVTLFSAVWDTTCLLNELYPFESYWGSQVMGFRIIAYSLTLVMIVAIVANRLFKKR